MAKPRITFTSLDGYSRTLQSDFPDPACRLRNFHPDPEPVGDAVHVLANEQLYRFRTSTRFACQFELPGLRMGGFAAGSEFATPLSIANELKLALLNGSTCSLFTEDAEGNSYATCGLMPGTRPEITLVDRRTMEYVLRIALINLAASPVPMVCHYFTGYERIAYIVETGGVYELAVGNELGEAEAWLKDDGTGAFDLDDDRAEKDKDLYLVDNETNLVLL